MSLWVNCDRIQCVWVPDVLCTQLESKNEVIVSSENSKTCVNRPFKKRQNLMTNGSLIKVNSIAGCHWSILQYFWPALSDNWSWKPIFGLFESGRFTQVVLYCIMNPTTHFTEQPMDVQSYFRYMYSCRHMSENKTRKKSYRCHWDAREMLM